ncbi:MAG: hypothetical protein ACI4A5_03310 [Hominilimicola sp.]
MTITKINYHEGNENKFYTIKGVFNGIKLNLTHDINTGKTIVHDWYKLTGKQLNAVIAETQNYIKNIA